MCFFQFYLFVCPKKQRNLWNSNTFWPHQFKGQRCGNLISSFNLAYPVLLKLKVLANKLLLKRQNLGQRNFILFENWCYSFLCVGYIILNNCLTKIIHSVPTPSGKFRQKSLNGNLMGRLTTTTKCWLVIHESIKCFRTQLVESIAYLNICIFWPDLFSRTEKNIGLFNIYCKLMVVDCQVNSELHLFCTRPYLPFCSLDKGVSRKFWPPQTFLVTNLKRQWKISNHQKTLCYWAFQNYFFVHIIFFKQ